MSDYNFIHKKYKIYPQLLGVGNFGKVFYGESIFNPEFKIAVKAVNKAKLSNEAYLSIKHEI